MKQQPHSDYTFSWEDLGDIETGRPNLGTGANILWYRLLQFSFKDVLTKTLGPEKTKLMFVQAGHLAGMQFAKHCLDMTVDFNTFIAQLANKLVELKMGVLRMEKSDPENMKFTLTISEDLDCSGLRIYGETVCDYDEGLIAGILEQFMGRPFRATEVDCWGTGDRTCRFEIAPLEAHKSS